MKQRICTIGCALIVLVILLQALPAPSQKTYQTPDGRSINCGDRGPLDRYKEAQEKEIKNLERQRDELVKLEAGPKKEIAEDEKARTEASNEVAKLDKEIGEIQGELNQAQGSEKRRLEDKLDDLKAQKIAQQAILRKASNDESAAQKELDNLKSKISDIHAQWNKYKDREKTADNSYTQGCDCQPGFKVNAETGKCQCNEDDPYWKTLCPPGQTCAGLNCGR